jgi:hypothetical protein
MAGARKISSIVGPLAILAIGFGAAAVLLARSADRSEPEARIASPPDNRPIDMRAVMERLLVYGVVPVWVAAGTADWLCHRIAKIEHSTGTKESLIHLLMLTEASAPLLAALYLEVTPPVLALMIVALLLHEVTALWDVSYAVKHRDVSPVEQHVHSFLEMMPLMAVSLIAALHWPKLLELFGLRRGSGEPWLRLKERSLPRHYRSADLAADLALEFAPYLEEFWRTLRARPTR